MGNDGSDEQRGKLVDFVRENIVINKVTRVDKANGDVLRKGVRVYLRVERKEKRSLVAVNWEGPFTIEERSGDTEELE